MFCRESKDYFTFLLMLKILKGANWRWVEMYVDRISDVIVTLKK